MTFEQLASLHVPAGQSAVLFCWTTPPQADLAVDLVRAWGFTYKTQLVWVKDKIGMGYYAQAGTNCYSSPPAASRPCRRQRPARQRDHRAARQALGEASGCLELIERMYPQASKRELFARNRRDGWLEPWGLDVPEAAAS